MEEITNRPQSTSFKYVKKWLKKDEEYFYHWGSIGGIGFFSHNFEVLETSLQSAID